MYIAGGKELSGGKRAADAVFGAFFKILRNVPLLVLAAGALSAGDVGEKIARLKDKDTGRRLEAISELGRDGAPEAREALLAELQKEKNPHIRARLADAFGAKRDKAATAELVKMARTDAAGDVRNAAVRALAFSKDGAAVPALIGKFTDKKELLGIRLQAANSLSHYPTDEAFETFVKALDAPEAAVKRQALVSLYNGFSWDRARVLPHVERMAKDGDAGEIAARYLKLLGSNYPGSSGNAPPP